MRRLPVIMITAYGTVENAVRAMQSGAANFIQKPWDNEKLLADVRAAVGGGAPKKKTFSSSAR
jgi:FixJ family two-component response regulator